MKRLSDELPDGFARELLESAQHDAPSTAAAQRALAAATAAVPLKGAAAAMLLSKVGLTVLATALVVAGAAAVHAALASRSAVARAPAAVDVAPALAPSIEAQAPAAAPASEAARSAAPGHASAETEPARPTTRIGAHAATGHLSAPRPELAEPAATPLTPSDDLRAQIELIDRARALVAQGDGAALPLLEGYARQWPRGPFVIDAAILAIEAERKSGAIEQARARAQRVLADHPSAAYRARVQRALNDVSIP
jgi:hypothetical protein